MGKLRQRWEEKNTKEAVEKVRTKEMTIREPSKRYSVTKNTIFKFSPSIPSLLSCINLVLISIICTFIN